MSSKGQRAIKRNLDVLRNSSFVQSMVCALVVILLSYTVFASTRNITETYSLQNSNIRVGGKGVIDIWLLLLAIAVSVFSIVFTRGGLDLKKRTMRMVVVEILSIAVFSAMFVYYMMTRVWALSFVILFPIVHGVCLYDNVKFLMEDGSKNGPA